VIEDILVTNPISPRLANEVDAIGPNKGGGKLVGRPEGGTPGLLIGGGMLQRDGRAEAEGGISEKRLTILEGGNPEGGTPLGIGKPLGGGTPIEMGKLGGAAAPLGTGRPLT
jgi:hypothetical protein